MSQRRRITQLLVAAVTMLLTGSLVGSSGLVLCRGANGHRAIEFDHSVTGCPTLASSKDAGSVFVLSRAECIDVPSVSTGPMTSPSFDPARVPMPPLAFLVPAQEPLPRIEMGLSAQAAARASPPDLAVHLRSTVLLV